MKVLLINPISKTGESVIRTGRCQIKCLPGIGIYPPIDLAYIATNLKKDVRIDVGIYDAAISGNYKKMMDNVKNERPQMVIMNCTTPTLYNDLMVAKEIKEILPRTLVVFFGIHASVHPIDIFFFHERRTSVDYILHNEIELTALELCQTIIENKNIDKIQGISYCDSKNLVCSNPRIALSNLDMLGIPARELLDNKYYKLQYNNEPYTIIQTSRGCANSCIYCTATVLGNRRPVNRTVNSVIEEIKIVVNKYKLKNIMFMSDTFTFSRQWVIELCQQIIDNNIKIKWMANSRVDKIDLEMALLMKKAGCWIVSLGIESADDDILKNAKKNITITQISQALEIFTKAKIKTIGYFMFGLPGETHQTIEKTINYAKNSSIDYGYFYVATPYPETEFYHMAISNKWLKSKDWSKYFNGESDVIEYSNLTANDMKRAVKKAYMMFYLKPKRLIARLGEIRSFYLLKKYIEISISILKKMLR